MTLKPTSKNLKAMPATNELVDKCIECGFCEPVCPSNALTLTPRQRIVSNRHMSGLEKAGKMEEAAEFRKLYQYDGVETCATCSLCSLSCPVKIDTGSLTKILRSRQIGSFANSVADKICDHYGATLATGRMALSAVKGVNAIIPDSVMSGMSGALRKLSGDALPQWTTSLPGGTKFKAERSLSGSADKVVYFSSCINRTMGNPRPKGEEAPLDQVVIGILERAGYEVIIPTNVENLCCGMPFSSKGFTDQGKKKNKELEDALRVASRNGAYPILCDMSPCSKTIAQNFPDDLKVDDTVEFIHKYLIDKLDFTPVADPIVIHTTCSTRKTGLADMFIEIAKMCSTKVTVPTDVGCCGFAGDRGFTFPELNKSALRHLKEGIPNDTKLAFSTSKTCEIGLTEETGLDYRSIFYLVDRVTIAKTVDA